MHCSLCLSCISLLDKVFSVVVLDRLFSFGRQKKWLLVKLNKWSSYTVMIVRQLPWVDSALVVWDECWLIVRALRGGWGAGGWGVDLAFDDTKVWSYHLIRIPAVIKETSFLKSASWPNSQSRCWKIAKYWYCSTKFGTILNHMEWLHYTDLMMKISV